MIHAIIFSGQFRLLLHSSAVLTAADPVVLFFFRAVILPLFTLSPTAGFSYLQMMAQEFSIMYNDELIRVTTDNGQPYYELFFADGTKQLLAGTERGWRYILSYRADPSAVEDELMSEESSIELGLEVEAEAIGILITAKMKELRAEK